MVIRVSNGAGFHVKGSVNGHAGGGGGGVSGGVIVVVLV